MTDVPMQPTPGQMLAGQTPQPQQQIVGSVPLAQRLAQDPSLRQQQPPRAPAPPTPQQQDAVRHYGIGKAASFLFGNAVDPNTLPCF